MLNENTRMKLTKNEIKILEWHLRRYLKGHQPDHPREIQSIISVFKKTIENR